jgi:hypothetical protein
VLPGERAPQSSGKLRRADWGRLRAPKSAKDSEFRVLAAGFNCDVFGFARHEAWGAQTRSPLQKRLVG